MENENGKFYRDKFFDAMNERFDRVDERLNSHSEQLAKIQGQMRWVYGYVAGIGLAASMAWEYVKQKWQT